MSALGRSRALIPTHSAKGNSVSPQSHPEGSPVRRMGR
jgi:hypothetical protein